MRVPGRDTVDGIDVSRWQGSIAWAQVAASGAAGFAFIKATGGDGGLYEDGQFRRNAAEATRVGIPWGAYHFASRMVFDPTTEARHFIAAIRGTGWTLPPVLDWEPSPGVDGTKGLAWVLAFCATIERELGVTPVIYTGAYVSLDRGPALLRFALWLAAYTAQPIPCAPWGLAWTIWQWTSSARIPGITANTVDANLGDRAWLAAAGAGQTTRPPVTTEPEEDREMNDDDRAYVAKLISDKDARDRAAIEAIVAEHVGTTMGRDPRDGRVWNFQRPGVLRTYVRGPANFDSLAMHGVPYVGDLDPALIDSFEPFPARLSGADLEAIATFTADEVAERLAAVKAFLELPADQQQALAGAA